jgi:hypothetical protein
LVGFAGSTAGALATVRSGGGVIARLIISATKRTATMTPRLMISLIIFFLSWTKAGTLSVTVEEPVLVEDCLRALGDVAGRAVLHAVLGFLQRAFVVSHHVDLVLAHVLVGARALVAEELGVLAGEVRHHVVVRARDHDLAGTREAHDALRDVDAVADDVRVPVDVLHELHRAQVDPHAHRVVARCLDHGGGHPFADHRLAQRQRHEERVFRIAEEADRRAITRVEDDAVVDGDVLDRLREDST